jgi:microcystin-dependent protein
MSYQYLAEIRMFAGNFAPYGWQFCNGQTLAISSNQALFSIIGTYFGGNGTTTFQLPNLQSRVPIHQGQGAGLSSYVLGQQGGTENVTLTTQQMPQHNHTVNAVAGPPSQDNPSNNLLAKSQTYSNSTASTTMAPAMINFAGNSQPHANIQPYLCVSFIIALIGQYPSRN